jgi:hypothetical protein
MSIVLDSSKSPPYSKSGSEKASTDMEIETFPTKIKIKKKMSRK